LGALKPKVLNRIAKIGSGHLCLREENLSFINNLHYLETVNMFVGQNIQVNKYEGKIKN